MFLCGFKDCQMPGMYVCSRCEMEYYCGKPCQLASFPSHRSNCFQLPQLRSVEPLSPSSLSSALASIDLTEKTMGAPALVARAALHDAEPAKQPSKSTLAPLKVPPYSKSAQQFEEESPKKPEPPKPVQKPEPPKPVQTQQPSKPVQKPEPPKPESPKKAESVSADSVVSMMNMKNLRRNHQAAAAAAAEPEKPIFLKDLKRIEMPGGPFKAVFLTCDSTTKIFSVHAHDVDTVKYREDCEQKIKAAVSKMDDVNEYTPKKNEIVLAKYDEDFYRAVVKGKETDGFAVVYIDYGDKATIKTTEMKPLDPKLNFDITINQVSIDNFPAEMTPGVAEIIGGEFVTLENIKKGPKDLYTARIVGI